MDQGYFLMKGLQKVGAQMSLTVLSYNIKRALNIIGVKRMVEALPAIANGVNDNCNYESARQSD